MLLPELSWPLLELEGAQGSAHRGQLLGTMGQGHCWRLQTAWEVKYHVVCGEAETGSRMDSPKG